MLTETRTYVGLARKQTFEGLMGLRINTRYTGVPQGAGTVLVAAVGVLMETGVRVSREEWAKWFVKR